MINNTLIGADGVVMTLSGRLEIGYEAAECAFNDRTVIEAHPGVGVSTQRIVLNGLRILDVETLPRIDYNNYPFGDNIDRAVLENYNNYPFRGPGGKA